MLTRDSTGISFPVEYKRWKVQEGWIQPCAALGLPA
jgi:hypothetical protein